MVNALAKAGIELGENGSIFPRPEGQTPLATMLAYHPETETYQRQIKLREFLSELRGGSTWVMSNSFGLRSADAYSPINACINLHAPPSSSVSYFSFSPLSSQ